ncbi:hypothetical protein ACLB2K_073378 [Fragaria x ananassa]
MGQKKPTLRGDKENPQPAGGETRKKNLVIEDDEYSVGTELSEESQVQEKIVPPSKGKKGKKGNSKAVKGDEDEGPQVVFTGKKKGKGEDDENEDELAIAFTGKKKAFKGGKKGGSVVFAAAGFSALDDEEEDEVENNDEDDDIPQITFSAMLDEDDTSVLKSSRAGDDTVVDKDASMIRFTTTGKNKSSKKKGNSVYTALGEEVGGSEIAVIVEPEQPTRETSKVEADDSKASKDKDPEFSKSRRKKKRTAQEEDDLDKILAELGEKEEKVEISVDGSAAKEAQVETVESAAAKKKKKKREKKAATAGAVLEFEPLLCILNKI